MNPFYLPKFLLIIIFYLFRECLAQGFGQLCDPPPCTKNNLVCPPTPPRTCVCISSMFTSLGLRQGCVPWGKLGETCGRNLAPCDRNKKLRCLADPLGTGFTCQCGDPAEYNDGKTCSPRKTHGDVCSVNPDNCRTGVLLTCQPTGGGLGTCECASTWTWNGKSKQCIPQSIHNEPCTFDRDCRTGFNLKCSQGKCVCSPPNLVPSAARNCGPRSKFGETCNPAPACENGPSWNLGCHRLTGKCVCTPGNVEWHGLRCGPIGKLGDTCNLPICDARGNLECDANKVCVCTAGNVEHELKVCGRPAIYRQKCGPPICEPGRKLECKFRQCACMRNYQHDGQGGCVRTPSGYGEPCQADNECRQAHKLLCDPQTTTCDCLPQHDLNRRGETPCEFNRFNGRTYRTACDQNKPIRRCVVAHNLTCDGQACRCIDKHIPDTEPLKDPKVGAITCKLAAGSRGHGDLCVPNSNIIDEKCDSLLDLACESEYKVCTCVSGFVPIGGGGGKGNPCHVGKQTYNDPCDPPEIIVPPRGNDPITGLPLPGPTSPPPPKLACDPARKLMCDKGKCLCPDQGVAGRYRWNPELGKCLITGGYACLVDEECFHGECVDRVGTGTHTHDEKICTPFTVCSAILGLSDSSILLPAFLIGLFNYARV